jgi:hypothetical protein
MLDEVAAMADHAGDQLFPQRQLDFLPDLPFVRVPGI